VCRTLQGQALYFSIQSSDSFHSPSSFHVMLSFLWLEAFVCLVISAIVTAGRLAAECGDIAVSFPADVLLKTHP
jgi:hypothetical protein